MVAALPAAQGPGGGARVTRGSLVVIGGGEHARVVVDAARATGVWEVLGIVDADPAERTRLLLGVAHLGDDATYLTSIESIPPDSRATLVLGIGGIGLAGRPSDCGRPIRRRRRRPMGHARAPRRLGFSRRPCSARESWYSPARS